MIKIGSKFRVVLSLENIAASLKQGAATSTASIEPILKPANLIAIFRRKMTVVSRKHLGNSHQLCGSGSTYCFKDPALEKKNT